MSSNIPNKFDLSSAMSDIYYSQYGGLLRSDRDNLLENLRALQEKDSLNVYYKDNVLQSLIKLITGFKQDKFDRIFSSHSEDLSDSNEKSLNSCLPILCEALLQRNWSKYPKPAFDDLTAFQAIVSTIHEVAVEKISSPMPPLVTWVKDRKSASTITAKTYKKITKTNEIPNGIDVGVVCLPFQYRNGGLLAWSVMGHEVAGHNFLQSKSELVKELAEEIEKKFKSRISKLSLKEIKLKENDVDLLYKYWKQEKRVEELASDILGIFSTGPSMALGCIGYFRGVYENHLLKTEGPFDAKKSRNMMSIKVGNQEVKLKKLSKKIEFSEAKGTLGKTFGKEEEVQFKIHKVHSGPHPIMALRPFAMTEAINHLPLKENDRQNWIKSIEELVETKEFSDNKTVNIITMETNKFPPEEKITKIPFEIATLSAKTAANIIATTKLNGLDNKKLTDIFRWESKDETLVNKVRGLYKDKKGKLTLPRKCTSQHIVAAAVIESCIENADIGEIFQRMKKFLIQDLARIEKS